MQYEQPIPCCKRDNSGRDKNAHMWEEREREEMEGSKVAAKLAEGWDNYGSPLLRLRIAVPTCR